MYNHILRYTTNMYLSMQSLDIDQGKLCLSLENKLAIKLEGSNSRLKLEF